MVQRPLIGSNRVFVRTELGQVTLNEIVELLQCTRASRRPSFCCSVTKLGFYFFIYGIAFVFKVRWLDVILWRWQTILCVEVPATADRFARNHKNA